MAETIAFAYTAGAYADVAPDPSDLIFDRFMQGRAEVFKGLREQGFSLVVSTEGQSSFRDMDGVSMVHAYAATEDALPGSLVHKPVSDLAVVVNRTSKILRVPGDPTTVNNPAVYGYGNNKLRTHQDILGPLDIGIPTAPIDGAEGLEAAFDQFGGGDIMLKPVMGSLTKGAYIASPEMARRLVREEGIGTDTPYIAQPRLDFTLPWPRTTAPLTAAYEESFQPLRLNARPKELRVYTFANTNADGDPTVTSFPVARYEGTDGAELMGTATCWTGIDPETVPSDLYEKSGAAVRRLAELTGSQAVYACMDWGYGRRYGSQEDPRWWTIEGNFCGPGLVGTKRFGEVGTIATQYYVEFLGRAASSAA